MSRPKGSKNKPKFIDAIKDKPGEELTEGVIPKPKIINEESMKDRCQHGSEHHDPAKHWCNSCGCLKYNGCGS